MGEEVAGAPWGKTTMLCRCSSTWNKKERTQGVHGMAICRHRGLEPAAGKWEGRAGMWPSEIGFGFASPLHVCSKSHPYHVSCPGSEDTPFFKRLSASL